MRILKIILSFTGSQCKLFKTGVMWADFFALTVSLAVVHQAPEALTFMNFLSDLFNKIWKIFVSYRLYISCTPVAWTAKTRASASFLRSACWILHFANLGNGPLSNKKFPVRNYLTETGHFFFLMPFNSRNATHFVYLWRQFLYKYIQKIFRMTNNSVGL